jgi:hypothetical protein
VTLLAGKDNQKKEYPFPDDFYPGSDSASGTVSGDIGVVVGFVPAFTASRLDPVDAMNSV